MNTDKLTSIFGTIAAISTGIGSSGMVPAAAPYLGLTTALSIALLGFFTNKKSVQTVNRSAANP